MIQFKLLTKKTIRFLTGTMYGEEKERNGEKKGFFRFRRYRLPRKVVGIRQSTLLNQIFNSFPLRQVQKIGKNSTYKELARPYRGGTIHGYIAFYRYFAPYGAMSLVLPIKKRVTANGVCDNWMFTRCQSAPRLRAEHYADKNRGKLCCFEALVLDANFIQFNSFV